MHTKRDIGGGTKGGEAPGAYSASLAGQAPIPIYMLANLPPAGTAGRLALLQDSTRSVVFDTGFQWVRVVGGICDVYSFGAKGDGANDDTAAFQSAIDAAVAINGTVEIPPPPIGGAWNITRTLLVQPGGSTGSGAGQCRLRIRGMGNFGSIKWTGSSNTSMFVFHGLKDSTIENLNITVPSTVSGLIIFDHQPTSIAQSSSWVTYRKCYLIFSTGGNCVGWRTGQSAPTGGVSDHADFSWHDCHVNATGKQYGDIAWQIGGSQTIPQLYTGCSGSNVFRLYMGGPKFTLVGVAVLIGDLTITVVDTTGFRPTGTLLIGSEQITYTGKTGTTFTGCTRGANGTVAAGHGLNAVTYEYVTAPNAGVYVGAESLTWIGGGGSSNANHFCFVSGGEYNIIGYRAESTGRFLQTGVGASGALAHVNVIGCEMASFIIPTDGIGFYLTLTTNLRISNCNFSVANPNPIWGAAFVTELSGNANGSILFENSNHMGTDPWYTLFHPTYDVQTRHVILIGESTGAITGPLAEQAPRFTVQALTYGTTVTPNPRLGEYMQLAVTNGVAFTIANPSFSINTRITLEITNSSGGALGAITWGTNYVLTNGAWVSPANGLRRSITFAYNGTKWIELYRSTADF